MELKRIVRAAVRRWREKQRARNFNGRTAAPAPYKKEEGTALPEKAATSAAPAARMEERLAGFLDGRYEFRFNLLAEVTEFRPKDGEGLPFRTATERDLNALCLEAHRGGVPCWDRDLMRMVHSTRVPAYHPFRLYFERLPQWDGRDRLRELAGRVSGDPLWIRAFHRWMLGTAAQWAGLSDGMHAQCVAPLLVSDEQGMGKSTFCRAILPPELRPYYSDSVDLARPEAVERQLTEMGLLNLDEFDRIPARKHPLLKNLMQLAALNVRKAYKRHASALPRIAAFIGTSNSRELLSDPSGSRRFVCVLVEKPIDSTGIEHDQVYAQLKAELLRGERHWFSREEENALRLHNAAFYRVSPVEEVFRRHYRPAVPHEKARLVALPDLLASLRRRQPGTMAGVNLMRLAQALAAMGVQKVHTHYGNRWRVVELPCPN